MSNAVSGDCFQDLAFPPDYPASVAFVLRRLSGVKSELDSSVSAVSARTTVLEGIAETLTGRMSDLEGEIGDMNLDNVVKKGSLADLDPSSVKLSPASIREFLVKMVNAMKAGVLLAFLVPAVAIGGGSDIDGNALTRESKLGYVDGDATTVGDVADFVRETDPTVPAWAKKTTKPAYTASEVGAVPTSRKVNGKVLSSDVTLTASDVGAVPTSRKVNGKVLSSDVTLTASDVGAVSTQEGADLGAYVTGVSNKLTSALESYQPKITTETSLSVKELTVGAVYPLNSNGQLMFANQVGSSWNLTKLDLSEAGQKTILTDTAASKTYATKTTVSNLAQAVAEKIDLEAKARQDGDAATLAAFTGWTNGTSVVAGEKAGVNGEGNPDHITSIGCNAVAGGYGVAIGSDATAGENSVAIGYSWARGKDSTAIGRESYAPDASLGFSYTPDKVYFGSKGTAEGDWQDGAKTLQSYLDGKANTSEVARACTALSNLTHSVIYVDQYYHGGWDDPAFRLSGVKAVTNATGEVAHHYRYHGYDNEGIARAGFEWVDMGTGFCFPGGGEGVDGVVFYANVLPDPVVGENGGLEDVYVIDKHTDSFGYDIVIPSWCRFRIPRVPGRDAPSGEWMTVGGQTLPEYVKRTVTNADDTVSVDYGEERTVTNGTRQVKIAVNVPEVTKGLATTNDLNDAKDEMSAAINSSGTGLMNQFERLVGEETTARKSADSALTASLANEATARANADSTLTKSLASHASDTNNPHGVSAKQIGAATTNDLNDVRAAVYTWENFLDGSNVVFSITNYISGSYPVDVAKLRILELKDGEYHEVYNSRDEILAHLDNFRTNDFATATNALVTAVDERVDGKADRAWGKYTSEGSDAPSNTVWMTAPSTVFAGGMEYQRVTVGEGSICVLVDRGAPTWTQGDEGVFKFQDDGGTNYFGFAKTDSYTIGCDADDISVSSSQLVTLTYSVSMNNVPCIWYKAALDDGVDWEQLNLPDGSAVSGASHTVTWDENPGAGKEVCYINCANQPHGFFKATVEVAGSAKFVTNMPADLMGGLVCTNTATGANGVIRPIYNGTGVSWTWQEVGQ